MTTYLSVQVVCLDVCRDLRLPLVAVVEQLLLVVKQLLVCLRRELKVGALHDRVDGTGLLEKERGQTMLSACLEANFSSTVHATRAIRRAFCKKKIAVEQIKGIILRQLRSTNFLYEICFNKVKHQNI